jgi:hypothetical protein
MESSDERKVMILHNFRKDEYLKIVKALEEAGIGKKTIVAVTTPTTMEWNVGYLIKELLLEDEEIKKNKN